MNLLDVISHMIFLILIILSMVIEFRKVKYINWILYSCVAISFLIAFAQRLLVNSIGMWLAYLGVVFSIFVNTSKFGMRYKRRLRIIFGNQLYVIHAILGVILLIIAVKFQSLISLITLAILLMAYIDFKNYRKEH